MKREQKRLRNIVKIIENPKSEIPKRDRIGLLRVVKSVINRAEEEPVIGGFSYNIPINDVINEDISRSEIDTSIRILEFLYRLFYPSLNPNPQVGGVLTAVFFTPPKTTYNKKFGKVLISGAGIAPLKEIRSSLKGYEKYLKKQRNEIDPDRIVIVLDEEKGIYREDKPAKKYPVTKTPHFIVFYIKNNEPISKKGLETALKNDMIYKGDQNYKKVHSVVQVVAKINIAFQNMAKLEHTRENRLIINRHDRKGYRLNHKQFRFVR